MKLQKRTLCTLALSLLFLLAAVAPGAYAADKAAGKAKAPAADKAAKNDKAAKTDKSAADEKAKNEKAAVVNGVVITVGELDQEMGRYTRQMAMMGQTADPAKLAEMRKKVLDGLIGREVLKQEAQKQGIKVDDAELQEQISALKKKFQNEEEYKSTLTKMNITEAELKSQFAQDMAIKKMIDQQVASKVTVSAEETKAFYDSNPDLFKAPERVRASHILIKVDPKASDADKAKARERLVAIQKRLQGGEDFAALAKEASECPSSANGGDLDFFQRGQMVGPFEEAAFALKVGQVSDIVETEFGYHLIKVTDKKEAGTTSYDEMKDRIAEHLKQEKVKKQVTDYLADLKAKAKIETFVQ